MIKLNRQGLVLSALMLAALVGVVAGPIHRFVSTWQPIFLIGAAFLIALEAGVVHHAFRDQRMWLDEFLRYVVPELFVMAILIRVATTLGSTSSLTADARRWLYDPLSIFDIPFVLSLGAGLLIGLLAHLIMRDLLALEPRSFEKPASESQDSQFMIALAKQDRAAALGRVSSRFVMGGVVMLLALALEAVNVERIAGPGLPISALSTAAALVYFVSGFLLYSQARLALLKSRWRVEGARVADDVALRWNRISWLIVVGVLGFAALLPRGDQLGLLATLQQSLGLIGYVIVLIGYVLTSLLGLLAIVPILLLSLLLGKNNAGQEQIIPPLPLIPPPSAPPPGVFEPNLWAGLVFWLCMLLLAAYAVSIVLRRNPGLVRALTSRGPLAWLLARLGWLWRDTRSWAGQATERARALLRRPVVILPARLPGLRLRRLAPRELVRYFYRSTLRRAASGGLPRRASQTPYEYSAILAERLPAAGQDIAELTESFVQAEYSARAIAEADAARARRPWERVRRRLRELASPSAPSE